MKKSMCHVLLSSLLILPLPIVSGAEEREEAQIYSEITGRDRAEALVTQYGVSSVQYAVMYQGEITQSGQAGLFSKEDGSAPTSETLYGLGSVSKMFTAAAIMKLVDDGKIVLDEPVVSYLPDFVMADRRYQDITVRMLLNHSSGLMGSNINNIFLAENSENREGYTSLLEDLKVQRLKADPGAFSVYCNDGFTLAEMIVERVSGQSFTEYIHEVFTEPLGMDHTYTLEDAIPYDQIARGYDPIQSELELPVEITHLIGTGGIYSTAEDLCRFGQIFTGERDLLSEGAQRAMMEKEYLRGQWLPDGPNTFGYGLGWDGVFLPLFDAYDIQALGKGGDTLQMHSYFLVLPQQDLSVAVVSSGGTSAYNSMLATQLALEELEKQGEIEEILPSAPVYPPEGKPMDQDFSSYQGYYAGNGMLYQLRLNETGGITLEHAYDVTMAQDLIYVGDGQFQDQMGISQFSFLDQNGHTYLVASARQILPGVGESYSSLYVAQKLPEYEMPQDAAQAWLARNDKIYIQTNVAYDSQVLFLLPISRIKIDPSFGGYLVGNQIVDANVAQPVLELPIMAGRDMVDFRFFQKDGVEYMQGNDAVFVEISQLPVLEAVEGTTLVKLPEDGYGQWFRIGEKLDGKTITVALPEKSGFVVYDPNGTRTHWSVTSGDEGVLLQKDGYLYLQGKGGAEVELKAAYPLAQDRWRPSA